MARYRFSHAERFGIFDAYGGQCYWCGHVLDYASTQVDHVIPESIDDQQLEHIKSAYMLPADFVVNDFCNWVPSHDTCNKRKSNAVFAPSPAMIAALDYVGKRAATARARAERVEKNATKAKVLARVATSLETGQITKEDILELFEGDSQTTDRRTEVLQLTADYKVVREGGSVKVELVARGNQVGATAVGANVHPSWFCSYCGVAGPWNGTICLTCGNRDAPD